MTPVPPIPYSEEVPLRALLYVSLTECWLFLSSILVHVKLVVISLIVSAESNRGGLKSPCSTDHTVTLRFSVKREDEFSAQRRHSITWTA